MKLVQYPDRRLTTPCIDVEVFDKVLHKQVQELNYALSFFKLRSISSNQLGGVYNIFSMFLDDSSKKVLVNPHIVEQSMPKPMPEICGSFPGCVFQDILRPSKITIEYTEFPSMTIQQVTFRGPQARLVAHEMDHLGGIITDGYIPQWKKRFWK
jgi:peptide deformylase